MADIKIPPRVESFCRAIQEHEGWYGGSRSWRNRNPGNMKCSAVMLPGASGEDQDGFCIFQNYKAGWDALVRQVMMACEGRSGVYAPDMDFYEFFGLYAPDGPHMVFSYAEAVSRKVGLPPETQIRELLSKT